MNDPVEARYPQQANKDPEQQRQGRREGEQAGSTAVLATRDPAGWQVWNAGGAVDGDYGYRITSQGATHYGWAQVHVQADRDSVVAVLLQWAYESEPSTPITVGAVPEPSSLALLLVGAAALLRRRGTREVDRRQHVG